MYFVVEFGLLLDKVGIWPVRHLVPLRLDYRSLHAQRGFMGNQGKIAEKQSGKIYVFLHISVLSVIFEKKLLL